MIELINDLKLLPDDETEETIKPMKNVNLINRISKRYYKEIKKLKTENARLINANKKLVARIGSMR